MTTAAFKDFLATVPPELRYYFCIDRMDWLDTDGYTISKSITDTLDEYEEKEQNYYEGMQAGFNVLCEILSSGQKIDVDLIIRLHDACVMPIIKKDGEKIPAGLGGYDFLVGLNLDFNINKAGARLLFKEMMAGETITKLRKPYFFTPCSRADFFKDTACSGTILDTVKVYVSYFKSYEYGRFVTLLEQSKVSFKERIRLFLSKLFNEDIKKITDEEVDSCFKKYCADSKSQIEFKKIVDQSVLCCLSGVFGISKARLKITTILESYYKEINTPGIDDDGKLSAIIHCIHKLSINHPFADGNTRTFVFLLMQILLMQNNFPPAIMYNPNNFEGFDEKTLLLEVKKSMAFTRQFYKIIKDLKQQDKPLNDKEIILSLQNYSTKLLTESKTVTEEKILADYTKELPHIELKSFFAALKNKGQHDKSQHEIVITNFFDVPDETSFKVIDVTSLEVIDVTSQDTAIPSYETPST